MKLNSSFLHVMLVGLIIIIVVQCAPYGKYVSALKSSDVEARRNAAFQLSACDRVDSKLLPKLLEALEDEDAAVREFTIKTIGKMDPRLNDVPQAICRGLRDPDIAVRRASAAIFSTMNPIPAQVLNTLAQSLGDGDSLLRAYVRSTFVDLGPIGVNALIHICRNGSGDINVRCFALTTLGTIGCEAKQALPILQAMLNDTNEQIRAVAQQSIERIQYSYFCPPDKQ